MCLVVNSNHPCYRILISIWSAVYPLPLFLAPLNLTEMVPEFFMPLLLLKGSLQGTTNTTTLYVSKTKGIRLSKCPFFSTVVHCWRSCSSAQCIGHGGPTLIICRRWTVVNGCLIKLPVRASLALLLLPEPEGFLSNTEAGALEPQLTPSSQY